MRNLYSKKGQLGNLQVIITTLIVVGILLGIGFLLLEEFKGTLDNEEGSVSLELLTTVTETGETVATAGTNCFNSMVVTAIYNNSGNVLITSPNYTYTTNGTIKYVAGSGNFNNTNWNVTYTYKYGRDGCVAIDSTIDATTTITTWLPIIIILLVVGIILVIVFNVLPSSGGSGGFSFGRGSSGGTTAEI